MDDRFKAERQLQFDKDAAAFESLPPKWQRVAVRMGNIGFGFRQGCFQFGRAVMWPIDWTYHHLLKAPALSIGRLSQKIFKGKNPAQKSEAAPPKEEPAQKDGKLKKFWQRATKPIRKMARHTMDFFEYRGAIGLYRATEWMLNPRRPSGKPFFTNSKMNKLIGLAGGLVTFGAMSAGFAYIEVMAKVWHVQLASVMLHSTLPPMLAATQQAALHTGLSIGLAIAQFAIVPTIAAARQTLKSIRVIQGASYQFNKSLRAYQAENPLPATPKPWQPSRLLAKSVAAVLEKTAPEFYRARLKHFKELAAEKKKKKALEKQKKQAQKGKKSSGVAAVPGPKKGDGLAHKETALANKEAGKAFNDNAPKESDAVPKEPVANDNTPKAPPTIDKKQAPPAP